MKSFIHVSFSRGKFPIFFVLILGGDSAFWHFLEQLEEQGSRGLGIISAGWHSQLWVLWVLSTQPFDRCQVNVYNAMECQLCCWADLSWNLVCALGSSFSLVLSGSLMAKWGPLAPKWGCEVSHSAGGGKPWPRESVLQFSLWGWSDNSRGARQHRAACGLSFCEMECFLLCALQ